MSSTPMAWRRAARDDCGVAQATFSGLAPGDYDVYVMPLDAAGNPILAFADHRAR